MLPRLKWPTPRNFALIMVIASAFSAATQGLGPPDPVETLGLDEHPVDLPTARIGDQANYVLTGTGSSIPQPVDGQPNLAFERTAPEATTDRFGTPHTAQVVRALYPSGHNENATTEEGEGSHQGGDAEANETEGPKLWVELHQAFAGVMHDPIWLKGRMDLNQSHVEYPLPLTFLGRPVTTDLNRSLQAYEPPPYLMSCATHNALQGRTLKPGDTTSLGRICPGLRLSPGAAWAEPARGTTFHGHRALELVHHLDADALGAAQEFDKAFDETGPQDVTVRLVAAEGLPFLAVVEATAANGTTLLRMELHGFLRGTGAQVPAWAETGPVAPEHRPGVQLAPLTRDGPQDGGSGLLHPLEEAMASLRSDPAASRFQTWLRQRPDAFVAFAQLEQWTGTAGARYDSAAWRIVMAAEEGAEEGYLVRSTRISPVAGLADAASPSEQDHRFGSGSLVGGALPKALGASAGLDAPGGFGGPASRSVAQATGAAGQAGQAGPADVVVNEDYLPLSSGFSGLDDPLPALTMASLLDVWTQEAPAPFNERAPGKMMYIPLTERAPAMAWLSSFQDIGEGENATYDLIVDLSNGGLLVRAHSHSTATYGEYDLNPGPLLPAEGLSLTSLVGAMEVPSLTTVVLAVGIIALVVGVLAALAHIGWSPLAYARQKGIELLRHPTRRRILGVVKDEPGVHFARVMELAELGSGTTAHHLNFLERDGFITSVKLAGSRHYYPAGEQPHSALPQLAVLRSPSCRAVYRIVRDESGITVSGVAERRGVSVAAASKTVDKLVKAGLVKKTMEWRTARLTAVDVPGWE